MDKKISKEKTFLAIPFEEKDVAIKSAGKLRNGSNAIRFDKEAKLWYAKPGADLNKVKQWLPDERKANQDTKGDPVTEFGKTLEAAGFVLKSLPTMDGKKHRVPTVGDKPGQRSGTYAGYLDGIPAGWYQDFRTHDKPVNWKSSSQQIDPETQAHLRAVATQKYLEKEATRNRIYDHNARRVKQLYDLLPTAHDGNQYLEKKGVKAFPGVKHDKQGRLIIPLQNEDAEIRSIQRIGENGFKSLKKNAQKTGNYFIVGDRSLAPGEPVLYAEGYSTAASIAQATARPVVMAVDSGNLPSVAAKLARKYPDRAHIVLGDDDHRNESNKGLAKAEEAAKIANGSYAVPDFTKEELDKGLTDFNDLHKARGLDAVKEQVEALINKTIMVDRMKESGKEPVITEKMDQEIDAALTSRQRSIDNDYAKVNVDTIPSPDKQAAKKAIEQKAAKARAEAIVSANSPPQPLRENTERAKVLLNTNQQQIADNENAKVNIDTIPDAKKRAAREAEIESNTSNKNEPINSVEPHIEQDKAFRIDGKANAWVASRHTTSEASNTSTGNQPSSHETDKTLDLLEAVQRGDIKVTTVEEEIQKSDPHANKSKLEKALLPESPDEFVQRMQHEGNEEFGLNDSRREDIMTDERIYEQQERGYKANNDVQVLRGLQSGTVSLQAAQSYFERSAASVTGHIRKEDIEYNTKLAVLQHEVTDTSVDKDGYARTEKQRIDELDSRVAKLKQQAHSDQEKAFTTEAHHPIIPSKVAKEYVEVNGKYYFGNNPDALAFEDKGAKLQTKLSSRKIAESMVDISEARGWTDIKVRGTDDFKREVWVEAASRGLTVTGYKPKEEDIARLKALTLQRKANQIEGQEEPSNTPSQKAPEEPIPSNDKDKQASQSTEPVNRQAGKLVDHGKAPYENNPVNRDSYYVTLENDDGKKSTTWGVDLERAVKDANVKQGERVTLENQGRQPVQVEKSIKNEQGQVVDKKTINTFRNTWEVKAEAIRDKTRDSKDVLKEHPDLVNEIAALKMAEKKISQSNMSSANQERFMEKMRDRMAQNVANGERAPEVKIREERIIQRENSADNER